MGLREALGVVSKGLAIISEMAFAMLLNEGAEVGDSGIGEVQSGETSLDEMIEAFGGVPKLKPRGLTGMTHSELTAVEKFIAFNNERLERDRRLEEELNQTRRAVKAFLEDDGKELGEAEVTPVPSPDASSGDGDEGGPK